MENVEESVVTKKATVRTGEPRLGRTAVNPSAEAQDASAQRVKKSKSTSQKYGRGESTRGSKKKTKQQGIKVPKDLADSSNDEEGDDDDSDSSSADNDSGDSDTEALEEPHRKPSKKSKGSKRGKRDKRRSNGDVVSDKDGSLTESTDDERRKAKSSHSKRKTERQRTGIEERMEALENLITHHVASLSVGSPSPQYPAPQSYPSISHAVDPLAFAGGYRPPPPPDPTLAFNNAPRAKNRVPSTQGLLNLRAVRGTADPKQPLENDDGAGGDDGEAMPKKPDYKRVDSVWDSSMYTFKLQSSVKTSTDPQFDGYVFHVRRTFDHENKYRRTYVDIKSKLLRECLQDVIKNVSGISLVDETPKLDPNLLYLYYKELKAHLSALKELEPAGETRKQRKKNQKRLDDKRKHLRVLLKYLHEDYRDIQNTLEPMLSSGLITYELLWALWKPNTLLYAPTYGQHDTPRAFKVDLAEKHSTMMKGEFYHISGKYFEFDGKNYGYGTTSVEVPEFKGARRITSLPCYPLEYHKDAAKLTSDLIERGKKFVVLSGVHFRAFSGMAFMKRKKSVLKFNINNSRIMVDPAIFRRTNPNYYVSTVRSKEHDDACIPDNSDASGEESGCECNESESADELEEMRATDGEHKTQYVNKLVKDENGTTHVVQVSTDSLSEEDKNEEQLQRLPDKETDPEGEALDPSAPTKTANGATSGAEMPYLTDEEYLIASPLVLGFSFAEKQWLEFDVNGVKDICWNDQAWDSLVLESGTKDLIKALVESRKFSAATTIDDVIQGKGKGLVTVLHGPPGTGKTLTAEGISELLKCPLYMVSAGELGTDSRFLEHELQKILDICHAWGAILLLDEADVFLEKRNMADIHRNALVSIFLRQLEYFQGILFLTTNRVETFDEAFQSRIHVALRYDKLDAKAKRAIFKLFIERVTAYGKIKVKPFTEEDLAALSKHDLNGREIKNVMGSAQDLAVNKGEPLSVAHVRLVLDVHARFGRDLKGGTGYEDAMRSYF